MVESRRQEKMFQMTPLSITEIPNLERPLPYIFYQQWDCPTLSTSASVTCGRSSTPRLTTSLAQSSPYHSSSCTIRFAHSTSSPCGTVPNHSCTSSSPSASTFSHAWRRRSASLDANVRQGSVNGVPRGGMPAPWRPRSWRNATRAS